MVNESKTKYMEVTCKPNNMQYLIVNNYKFEKVNEFEYLVMLITVNNNLTQEINHRLLLANKSYYGLKNNWDHYLSLQTKCKLYKTLSRPIILYGSESWALTKTEESKLKIFERKIYDPISENGNCHSRYNHELYQLYEDSEIIK
jgi:hypothetical protein